MSFNEENARQAEEDFIKNPCVSTRNKLILHHTGLVHTTARQYVKFISQDQYQDLIQEGMIGLMVASDKFDPAKKVKFNTYAGWWIRSHIQLYITDERAIYYNTIKKLAFDRNPNKKLPNEDARRAAAIRHPHGLNSLVGDENGCTWQDIIEDTSVNLEEDLINAQRKELLYTIAEPFLGKTKYRRKIFTDRLVSDNPKALQELGNELNLSREGVRLHEKALLEDLKKAFREYRDAC